MPKNANITILCSLLTLAINCVLQEGPIEDTTTVIDNSETGVRLSCQTNVFRYPTTATDFMRLYQNRDFYTDGRHLGLDINISVGTAIHPIACGIIRVYRPATGYGRLVVVIEHELPEPMMIKNGAGTFILVRNLLSIYGHLRIYSVAGSPSLAWKDGDRVSPDDIIGYVDDDATNGDGGVHLHFGIRLQSKDAAEKDDPLAWFRGYDTIPSRRHLFADPEVFMTKMMMERTKASWHPAGTVIASQGNQENRWVIGYDMKRNPLASNVAARERLSYRTILVSEEELACYAIGNTYDDLFANSEVVKFDDSSTVWMGSRDRGVLGDFMSYESFRSWGWKDADIIQKHAFERETYFGQFNKNRPHVRLRDGSLVKVKGVSEVSVIFGNKSAPIFNWETFTDMGYRSENIIELDQDKLEALNYEIAPVITQQTIMSCAIREPEKTCFLNAQREWECTEKMDQQPPDLRSLPDLTVVHPDLASDNDLSISSPKSDLVSTPDLLESQDLVARAQNVSPPDRAQSSDQSTPLDLVVIQVPDMRSLDMATPNEQQQGKKWVYAFAVRPQAGFNASEPYRLRDKWWNPVVCLNTGTTHMAQVGVWYECEVANRMEVFVGSFFSKQFPNSGDNGQIGTIGNIPNSCTPTDGIIWRIKDFSGQGFQFYGTSGDLPCVTVAGQSRHTLP